MNRREKFSHYQGSEVDSRIWEATFTGFVDKGIDKITQTVDRGIRDRHMSKVNSLLRCCDCPDSRYNRLFSKRVDKRF